MKGKNIFLLLSTAGGMVFLQGINFLIAILLARYLTPGEFGKYQLLFTMITTLAIITKLGMDEGFTFFIAKVKKQNESVGLLVAYIFILTTIFSIAMGILVREQYEFIDSTIISQFNFKYELKLVVIYLPAFVVFTTLASIMRGLELFHPRALIAYYLAPLLFLLLIWVSISYDGFINLPMVYNFRIYVLLLLSSMGIIFVLWKLQKDKKKHLSIATIKNYHKLALGLIFVTLIQYMAEQPMIDLLLLSHFMGENEIGIYAANYRLAILPLMVYLAFNVIYATKLSKLYISKEYKNLMDLFYMLKKRMLYITVILFIILLISYDFLILLFGEEYNSGKNIFIILLIGFSFVSMNGLNSSMLIIYEKKKFEFYLNLFFVLALIFGGYGIVMKYGTVGLASFNTILLLLIVILRRQCLKKICVLISN